MKLFLWIFLGLASVGLTTWMITAPGNSGNPLLVFLLVGVYGAAPVGTFWMLYAAIRHEKHPMPMMLLAFVPYASLWYYFERVRPVKHANDSRS